MEPAFKADAPRRRGPLRLTLAVMILVAAITAFAPRSAAADDVSISLSQSAGLDWTGQAIDVTVSGDPIGVIHMLMVCPTELLASGEPFDITDCTNLLIGAPNPPFTRTFTVGHDTHPSCETNECAITFFSMSYFPPNITDVYYEPISFGAPPPVPPTHPDFAMTVDTVLDLVNNLRVDVDVVHRNPATTTATLSLCPADIEVGDDPELCSVLQTIAGNEDISTALTLPILGVPGRDCGADPCAVVYRGSGHPARPVTEFLLQPVTFTPRSAIISIDGNVETVVGNNINVVWQALNADQIPTDRTIEAPKNYVGICLGDADPLQPFSAWDCEGVELGPDAVFDELDITATRSITTGREGTVDCVSYAAGCVVGYSLSYVDLEGLPFTVVLDRDSRPLTFERSVHINNGHPDAEPGALIGVSAQGVAAGPAGFVMMCAIGDQGGLDLRCSDDLGTVDAPFDGEFNGSITMPTSIDAGGDTFDCTIGRGCLVVFVVIDNDLSALFGHGHWVRGLS